MKRKKQIVVLAHCILNSNAKIYGVATEPAGCEQLVAALIHQGFGIIQLPCPEQMCFGINRWGQVKNQLNFPAFRAKCRSLLQPVVEQLMDFSANGYTIAAVIGIDGSPSCGVNYTCAGDWGGEIGEGYDLPAKIASLAMLREAGVMMEVFREMLKEAHLNIKFLAVDETNPDAAYEDIINQLK